MATNNQNAKMSKKEFNALERKVKAKANEELNGPFEVINTINKMSKTDSDIKTWLNELEVKKITSEMCLTKLDYRKGLVSDSVPMAFLKLKKFASVKNLTDILDSIVIDNERYAMVVCKFTINDFFASLRDARKIKAQREANEQTAKRAKLDAIMLKLRDRNLSDEERNRLIDEYEAIAA